ncbi:MAG: TM0996/MTH895 family glutaredoxin-like protein [Dehalococcoidaceae bacterium]|nr:TM0996/MTH895 family glutaredoxin-like protein [Dehalococcoidaceae bacterium]
MNIKVLGPGCAKCHKLNQLVKEALDDLKMEADLEYIQDMSKIMEYPILTTPGLVINEKVVSAGRVPSKQDIISMIEKAKAA